MDYHIIATKYMVAGIIIAIVYVIHKYVQGNSTINKRTIKKSRQVLEYIGATIAAALLIMSLLIFIFGGHEK